MYAECTNCSCMLTSIIDCRPINFRTWTQILYVCSMQTPAFCHLSPIAGGQVTIWRLPQRAKLAAKHSVQHYTHKSIFVNIFFLHVFEELRTCASPLWPLVAGIWSNSACLRLNIYNFCLFHCFGGMLCAIIECLVAFLLLCRCQCLCACATFLNLVTC